MSRYMVRFPDPQKLIRILPTIYTPHHFSFWHTDMPERILDFLNTSPKLYICRVFCCWYRIAMQFSFQFLQFQLTSLLIYYQINEPLETYKLLKSYLLQCSQIHISPEQNNV